MDETLAPGFMPSLARLESSSNGLIYYRSEVFGGAARGDIFVVKYANAGYIHR